jgi:hypothetical protein
MRFPFVPRRAFVALGMAHSLLRKQLVEEQTARRKAERRAAQLDQRLYEMQLASELHDQQLHTKKEDA